MSMKTPLLWCTALVLVPTAAMSASPATPEIVVAQAQPPGDGPMMDQRGLQRFQTMDTNRDGALTPEEVGANHEAIFEMMDADGDGAVTAEEFAGFRPGAGPGGGRMAGQHRQARFGQLDANGDGKLTKEEFAAGGAGMFSMMDRNEDGKITPDEMPGRMGMGGMGPRR
jgi:Ca2+-binding EF-hand superfamily protein